MLEVLYVQYQSLKAFLQGKDVVCVFPGLFAQKQSLSDGIRGLTPQGQTALRRAKMTYVSARTRSVSA